MAINGIRYNIDGLQRLKKNLSSKMAVKTGVLSGSATRTTKPGQDEIDNATLGAKMEMGSPMEKIPPRSWLEVPIRDNFKDYFISPNYSKELIGSNVRNFLDEFIGKVSVEVVQDGFLTSGFGKWEANSPVTIALKGSSRPLYDTGQLEKSISSKVVTKG